MALHESEAIVLQSYALGEADRLVSFFARTLGRVRGVAAGARKPKSRFGATLERLSYIRIWFSERENRELVRITQCEIIESFLDAFRDYPSSVALALFSEITQALLPDREPSDANFRLLLLASQEVKRSGKAEVPLAYFALWSVKLGGWLPPFDRCAKCGHVIGAGDTAFFSSMHSSIFDASCRLPGMRTLHAGALSAARMMMGERLDRIDGSTIDPRVAREVTDSALDLIEHQIDKKLASRGLLEPPGK